MKKRIAFGIICLLALSLLAACGSSGNNDGSGTAAEPDVDLAGFYTDLETEYGWSGMGDVEGELLENYYPGLSGLDTQQLVAKVPLMSAVVNEVVLVRCGSEEDAQKAAEILQARIDYQVGDDTNPGGAWYPESIESWKQAEVIRNGTYAALIAVAGNQSEVVEAFNALFA